MKNYFLSVDVGTKELRVGIVSENGEIVCCKKCEISLYKAQNVYYQQSSEEIWGKICQQVREIAELHPKILEAVIGMSFDATCSMVVVDSEMKPLSVSPPTLQFGWF